MLLLERVHALEKCPGRELRSQLASRLHVKPRQIQVWFQNKRQRIKNGAKPTVAEAIAHAVANSSNDPRNPQEPARLLMDMANSEEAANAPASAEGVPAAAAGDGGASEDVPVATSLLTSR